MPLVLQMMRCHFNKYLLKFLILTLIILFSSYKEEVSGGTNFDLDLESLSKDIIEDGSDFAYYNVSMFYFQTASYHEFYPLAKIMSDKHNYTQAYFDVFYSIYYKGLNINDIGNYNLDHLSVTDKNEALKYLIIAYEKGHSQAEQYLENYIKKDIYVNKVGKDFSN